MEDFLSPVRNEHCLAVSEMAAMLAAVYGADVEKARFAGRYHDIAKAFTPEQSNRLLREYGLPEKYFGDRALAHSKIGSAMLKEEFGVTDTDILNAVAYHTTGRRGMSLLEKIVYTADAIDATRSYEDVEYYRNLARTDLDRACVEIMDFTISDLKKRNKEPDVDTIEAIDYIHRNAEESKEN